MNVSHVYIWMREKRNEEKKKRDLNIDPKSLLRELFIVISHIEIVLHFL